MVIYKFCITYFEMVSCLVAVLVYKWSQKQSQGVTFWFVYSCFVYYRFIYSSFVYCCFVYSTFYLLLFAAFLLKFAGVGAPPLDTGVDELGIKLSEHLNSHVTGRVLQKVLKKKMLEVIISS